MGALLSNQVGQGRGNTAVTYAGNRVEQSRAQGSTRYEIAVKMSDGSMRNLGLSGDPGMKTRDKVRGSEGKLSRLP